MTGTCVTLLVSMIVTLTIFISLFNGLNALSTKQENKAFNEVYARHFISKPARSCVAVKDLPAGALCEIEAIVFKNVV